MLNVSNFKLGLGIPLTYDIIYADFFEAFARLEKPDPTLLFRANTGTIDVLRNGIVKMALEQGCSHLIMMDTDMWFPPDTIMRLLAHNLPIVGALCFRKYPPFEPFMQKDKKLIDEWQENELVEVDRTGTGCILYRMDVFNKISPPWFEFVKNDEGEVLLGEDYCFCDKLTSEGYRIFVDTGVMAEHLSTNRINAAWYKFWKSIRKQNKEVYDNNKKGE